MPYLFRADAEAQRNQNNAFCSYDFILLCVPAPQREACLVLRFWFTRITMRCPMGKSISRRSFLGFAVLGGLISFLFKKFRTETKKEAMFWRKRNDA